MGKLRVCLTMDGRYGFPTVVRYSTRDGRFHNVPPRDGKRYMVDILDIKAYEELAASGSLGLGHEYTDPPKRFDNRKTA